jgi:hypothetical protein
MKKLLFITISVFILILTCSFIIIKIVNKSESQSSQLKPTIIPLSPTPSIVPITMNPTQIIEIQKQVDTDLEVGKSLDAYQKKTPLLYLMPVVENDFKIEYAGNMQYKITLLGEDKSLSKQHAIDFWTSHKVDPETIDILWVE